MPTSPRVSAVVLAERLYLRTGECARLFGRGAAFWASAFDAGRLSGYVENGHRHIERESARALLLSVGHQRRASEPESFPAAVRRIMEGFNERFLAWQRN